MCELKSFNENKANNFKKSTQMIGLIIVSFPLFLNANTANASVLSKYQFTAVDNLNSQVDRSSTSLSTSQPLTYSSQLVPGNSVFVQTDQGVQKLKLLTSAVKFPGTINGVINGGTIIAWSEWLDTFTITGGTVGTKGNAIFQVLIEGVSISVENFPPVSVEKFPSS